MKTGAKWSWVAGTAALAVIGSSVLDLPASKQQTEEAVDVAGFEENTGVRLVRVAVTAAGGMIDLRYRTLNPDKALVVHDETNPPKLIHEATGMVVSRPWMDHSHDRELHTAVVYYELLMNPRGVIKRGDRVTLTIGDEHLSSVVVQ